MEKHYTLITGGSMGIGLALAEEFAKNGHDLILVARFTGELLKAKEQLLPYGVEVIIKQRDLFDPQAAFDLYNELVSEGRVVEILVNNAGQGLYGLFEYTDIRRELAIINLNICSMVVLSKFFLKDMLMRGRGRILNLSSIASKSPGPWQSVYHGTKACCRVLPIPIFSAKQVWSNPGSRRTKISWPTLRMSRGTGIRHLWPMRIWWYQDLRTS